MKQFFINLFNALRPKSTSELEYEWLSQSVDLAELERRQRQLQRGQGPFDTNYSMWHTRCYHI